VQQVLLDTLIANKARFRPPHFWNELGLIPGRYVVMTMHRPANVDSEHAFRAVLQAIAGAVRGLKVVFPVHPRTAKTLSALGALPANLLLVDPQPYLEFNHLVQHAKAVITDSGGVTEETTVMGVPCITMRNTTERPETVSIGTNELIGTDPSRLAPVLDRLFDGHWKLGGIPPLWDGKTSERIAERLEALLDAAAQHSVSRVA
jgi:UDP-N-acetylglucosamine 2-epimerase (non-hydrolysing)